VFLKGKEKMGRQGWLGRVLTLVLFLFVVSGVGEVVGQEGTGYGRGQWNRPQWHVSSLCLSILFVADEGVVIVAIFFAREGADVSVVYLPVEEPESVANVLF
jgi:hypothetical protein